MRWGHVSILTVVMCGLAVPTALAQRGVGDPAGVARQRVKPEIVTLAGQVVKVETGPCETTTGYSPLGTHFLMKTAEGKTVNIHLGPAAAVEFVAKELSENRVLKVAAFRTEQMKEDHYVARSLAYDGRTVTLRDESLQPVWAAGQGAGGGRGWYAPGFGRGAGGGRGLRYGWSRGYGGSRAESGYGYGYGYGCPRSW